MIGHCHEKRWGLLFKCQTTRCVHIETLNHLDTDSFLLALRRFVSRRGCPCELISDQGTNFVGGEWELRETFIQLCPSLQQQLAKSQVRFIHNTPHPFTSEVPGKEKCGNQNGAAWKY